MSGPKWTAAQKAAIEDRGGALLVSAAAGSGKTAVLTERAVRLITDPEHPVDADRLLIVTFTNAAAAELRARIGQALLQRSQEEPGNARLRRQRMLLQRAPICTIDAFCLDLLHKHFQALDIPPDFTPADPGSVEILRAEALAETMESACGDPDFCAFADLYGKGRSDKAAGDIILQIYDFLRALPYYLKKLDEFLQPWQTENGFAESIWKKLLLRQAQQDAAAAQGLLETAHRLCQEDYGPVREKVEMGSAKAADLKKNDKFIAMLQRLETSIEKMEKIGELAAMGEWEALYDCLTPCVLGAEDVPGLKGMSLTGDQKASVRACADEATALFEQISELVSCSEAEAEADRKEALPRLAALFRAVRDFDVRFTAKKRERKILEFSDFEHYALQLLQTPDGKPTELCGSIRQKYEAVMVDEYQDTNALQEELYRCLATPSGDDLFFVGDLKQSIYRFRQAEPGIFRQKLEQWHPLPQGMARPRPETGRTGENALLALDANFRSAPQVVAGINYIFGRLMSPELGDTQYGEGQRLVCGAPGEYQGGVQVEFLQDGTAQSDAEWIAGQICQMVESGMPVRDGSGTRPVRYEDCCILLSARTDFAVYAGELEKWGIPVYSDSRENLLEAAHIRPLIALLRVIDNPAQDICLAAVMLGPMFGFTEDDLVRLRADTLQDKKAGRRISLYGALLQAIQKPEDEFSRRLQSFYDRLTALRQMSRSMPVEQLMEEIFASTGYLAALGAMENGIRRREDARRFAAFCASAGANGFPALVRAIDAAALAGSIGQETTPGGAHPGYVSIMTIHRSKGLQFPVVFLAGTGRRFNATDIRKPVLAHRSCGVGLRLHPEQSAGSYKTAAYAAIANVTEQEMRSEQMRLLYVALTRAQDKLIITVPLGVGKSSNPYAKAAVFAWADAEKTLYQQANSFADWLRAVMMYHSNGKVLREISGRREWVWFNDSSEIQIHVQDETVGVESEEPVVLETPPDPELVQKLREGFAWKYPSAPLANVPAKVSVTSVVHRAEQTTLERPAFLSKDGLTAAERGTALHSFLEHVDFVRLAGAQQDGALEDAIRAERDRQVALRLMAPEIAEKLALDGVRAFVESEAFTRICAADQVLRELAFITALPAQQVMQAQGMQLSGAAAQANVLVQGIADLVLVYPDHLELLDYKTDHGKTEQQFLQAYRRQLELYAQAVEKRFAPKKVTYKGIYSFTLGRLIEATE